MDYKRMPIEIESPEESGYSNVKYNLAESSVRDTKLDSIQVGLRDLRLSYGDHRGKPELRGLLEEEHGIPKENILITAGAASALFIVATSLLEKQDHLIVLRPNYASNIETPRAIGCEIDYIDLTFEKKFEVSPEEIRSKIKKNTRLISLTHPHNPTGMIIPQDTLLAIAKLAEQHHCLLLVDETYRDLNPHAYPLCASLHPGIISVSSVSKAYGLPGIRIGWLICRDKKLFEKFLAAKEQIFLCNSIVDEEIAYQFLLEKEKHVRSIDQHVNTNRNILLNWISNETRIETIETKGGVVCFPRIKNALVDTKEFYRLLNEKYQTFIGPGHWFEMPDHYMRIGYGWPDSEELLKGLRNISATLDELESR